MPPAPLSLALGRFKQIPQRSSEVWQGGLVKLPAWVDDPANPGKPLRPTGAMWVSLRTGRVNMQLQSDGRAAADLALSALFEFAAKEAKNIGGRPARIEVRGPELKDTLAAALEGTSTAVVTVDDLPAVREILHQLELAESGRHHSGLMDAPGMTVDRVRAFADAAARFYEARPWQYLANEDLIIVESPKAPKGMACVAVLGQGGFQFGIGFFESRRAFERMLNQTDVRATRRAFGVTFGLVEELPFADVDLWDDHALPLAGPAAYPLPADITLDNFVRPNPVRLTYMETLLRALADTTEEELDSGRWSREVTTFDGPVSITLSLPSLLEDEAADEAPRLPMTPLEHAQARAHDAQEATGRRRIKLAREAMAISPDCVDAYLVLAETAPSPEKGLEWYQRAVEAAERALGPERFVDDAGDFWGLYDTRPYMRARLALANSLRDLGRPAEAIDHYKELLRLNRGDNQGVRYALLTAFLENGRDDEAGALLAQFEEDAQALWHYGRALWRFRTEGDSAAARAALDEAQRNNPHVVQFLLDFDSTPFSPPPAFELGSRDEAVFAAPELIDVLDKTAGAEDWVRRHARQSRSPRDRPRGHRGRKKRRT